MCVSPSPEGFLFYIVQKNIGLSGIATKVEIYTAGFLNKEVVILLGKRRSRAINQKEEENERWF